MFSRFLAFKKFENDNKMTSTKKSKNNNCRFSNWLETFQLFCSYYKVCYDQKFYTVCIKL